MKALAIAPIRAYQRFISPLIPRRCKYHPTCSAYAVDAVREFGEGVEVVIDKMSVPYLEGATIDFEDTIQKQGFTIDNPNAGGSCACGDSFH